MENEEFKNDVLRGEGWGVLNFVEYSVHNPVDGRSTDAVAGTDGIALQMLNHVANER